MDNKVLPSVARSAEECFVGPSQEELENDKPSWGSDRNQASIIQRNYMKRRKLGSNNDSTTSSTTSTSSSTFEHAVGTFLSSGCCCIENVLPSHFVNVALEKAKNQYTLLENELKNLTKRAIEQENEHLLAQVGRGDFRELVDRDGSRRDIRFQLDQFPFKSNGLIYNSIVYPLVKELLGGGEICLLYAGIMWASSNTDKKAVAESQKWHADGPHLFDHVHLPPHCINCFYPLVDLSYENGCTEFVPGSHQLGCFDKDSAKSHQFGLCCKAGGAIIFDYRLKHRGGSNMSEKPRPVLYVVYSKPFFRDARNTRSENSLLVDNELIRSPPWVSRVLKGEAMKMGQGFKTTCDEDNEDTSQESIQRNTTSREMSSSLGSGERSILLRMNIEVPDCSESKTITVYHGDVAIEVSTKFCQENGLDESFISVLQGAIQQQIDCALMNEA